MNNILNTLVELLPDVSEKVLQYYILQATNYFLTTTSLTAVPPNAYTVIINMVLEDVNIRGYEGLQNTNLSGVAYAFNANYSPKILKQIGQFRAITW